jgi:flagellar hook-associated protein 1 FlgK
MSVSSFMGLETTLRGILAQQLALNVTGHNIANANTPGYTRQTARMEASVPYTEPGTSRPPQAGQLGTGVTVAEYERVRDTFIDVQLRAQTMRASAAEATRDGLQQVELALAEPSSNGLNSLLERYWSAWHDVSNSPENVATRQALAQSAASLVDGFRTFVSQLDTIASQTADNVTATLADVNSIGRQIGLLNDTISRARLVGDQPNDLLDQRDVLLDRLAQLGNVSVTEGALGSVDVTIGGATLVSGTTASTLAETDFTSLTSGKRGGGLSDLRDTVLPGYRATIDGIASALITQTNTRHAAGFDLAGAAGGAFFTGTGAGDIAVSSAILASPSLIAASGNGTPGNADNALAIANLRSTPVVGGSTIDTAYVQLVTTVGSDAQEAQRTLENAALLAGSLEDRRQSVSGVSLDEEMTNLVKFQRGYQASARAMSAVDSMLETLITRTGRVGL